MEYKIKTNIHHDGKIEQLVNIHHNGKIEHIMRQITDTMEADVIRALIELGWTPPKDNNIKEKE